MTKYIERYTITMGSVDQEGNTGATVEVLDSTVTTYIWQNGVVKTMHYYPEDNVSNDIITSEFEYYDLDEIRPLPSVIKLQYYPEELAGEDRAEYGGEIIKKLSKELTDKYGKGYDRSNLYHCVRFYKAFHSSAFPPFIIMPPVAAAHFQNF